MIYEKLMMPLHSGEDVSDYSKLIEEGLFDYSTEFKEMWEQFDGEHEDLYETSAHMINVLMSSFPKLKESWATLTISEKWVFVEGICYGIESFGRQKTAEYIFDSSN